MADKDSVPVLLELDPTQMWTLTEDKKALTLNMEIPAIAGLLEPLTVQIDFDYDSVRAIIMQLRTYSLQMLR